MEIRKVVLIEPGRDGRIFGKATAAPYTLMRLASLVPDEIDVEIWDEKLGPLEKRILTELGPNDVVGITSKTLAIETAEKFTHLAHKAGVKYVAVGGAHATLMPEHVEQWADVVFTGESYFTWTQFLNDVSNDTVQPRYEDIEWANLSGIARLTDRVINMVDENRHYWTPLLEITRGCPRNCSFCTAIRVSGQKMRYRPVEEVVEEIERRGINRFFLTDDNFGLAFRLNPDYIEELFRALAKLPLRSWTTQAEMMVAQFPDLMRMAREAHLDKFFIGFESVNPENRRNLGGKSKGQMSQYFEAIEKVHATGLGVVGLFVYGFDNDTPETMWQTWEFARKAGLDSMSQTILTPYPGTPFREQLIRENRLIPNVPWRLYDTSHVTYYPRKMTVEEFTREYDRLCRSVYSSFRIAQRGTRALARISKRSLRVLPGKVFSSFSTDYGYRREFGWRSAT